MSSAKPPSAGESASTNARVRASLEQVNTRIARAAADHGRRPDEIQLVCVTKNFGVDAIRPALEAGQCVFGENRVQEALEKWPPLQAEFPGVELHLIGSLQSNKVREAVRLFDVIETVDRARIAEAIARERDRGGKCPRLYVEVNSGAEPQKAGVLPTGSDAFIADCRARLGLAIEGLMCIPPEAEPKSPHFALLASIARRNEIRVLSMGMSADFELAIQLGATHVRVGTAIFGARG